MTTFALVPALRVVHDSGGYTFMASCHLLHIGTACRELLAFRDCLDGLPLVQEVSEVLRLCDGLRLAVPGLDVGAYMHVRTFNSRVDRAGTMSSVAATYWDLQAEFEDDLDAWFDQQGLAALRLEDSFDLFNRFQYPSSVWQSLTWYDQHREAGEALTQLLRRSHASAYWFPEHAFLSDSEDDDSWDVMPGKLLLCLNYRTLQFAMLFTPEEEPHASWYQ
jgi:hypothetical protein